ncbi:carbamoyltransferase [Elusimicrobiota bacterium]
MYILGINMSHDRSSCLVKNGSIIAAIAEERLDRNKKSIGIMIDTMERAVPFRSVNYCLQTAGIEIDDLDLIVIDNAVNPVNLSSLREIMPVKDKQKIRSIPHPSHHLAHACSAFYCAPFKESAVLVVDAYGSQMAAGNEGESGYYALDNDIKPVFKNYQKTNKRGCEYYSLTYIYRFVSLILGFNIPYGRFKIEDQLDEAGKTMALAAYGKYRKNWSRIVRINNNQLDTKGFIDFVLGNSIGKIKNGTLKPVKLPDCKKFSRLRRDLAYKAQKEFEKGMIFLADRLYSETKSENLCIAGGAGLNCVANRKILDNTSFKNVFIQPAATDDGNAIGCAMYGWHNIAGRRPRFHMNNAFLGRKYSREDIKRSLSEHGITASVLEKEELVKTVANLISEGKIIGWFQGASEFGPRALGHRSILADPRNEDIMNIINKKVKKREKFRPYAPSILLENLKDYFDLDQASPFMLQVGKVKTNKKKYIPAVIHIDGYSRIQTVTEKDNGIFYDLIKEFYKLTGIPLILNTSFNTRGNPIVETPGEAINVFFGSKMDVLVLGDFILDKEGKGISEVIKDKEKTSKKIEAIKSLLMKN